MPKPRKQTDSSPSQEGDEDIYATAQEIFGEQNEVDKSHEGETVDENPYQAINEVTAEANDGSTTEIGDDRYHTIREVDENSDDKPVGKSQPNAESTEEDFEGYDNPLMERMGKKSVEYEQIITSSSSETQESELEEERGSDPVANESSLHQVDPMHNPTPAVGHSHEDATNSESHKKIESETIDLDDTNTVTVKGDGMVDEAGYLSPQPLNDGVAEMDPDAIKVVV